MDALNPIVTGESAAYATPKAVEASPLPLQKGRGVARCRLSRGLDSRVAPKIAVFAALALRQVQGRRKFGGFRLLGVTGSLIVARIIGQLGIGAFT